MDKPRKKRKIIISNFESWKMLIITRLTFLKGKAKSDINERRKHRFEQMIMSRRKKKKRKNETSRGRWMDNVTVDLKGLENQEENEKNSPAIVKH